MLELEEANRQNEREHLIVNAQRVCLKDADIDFDANRRAHYRGVLRGLYGLKNDLFYDPQGYDDDFTINLAESPDKQADELEKNDEDDNIIEHYTMNYAELNRML